MEGLIGSATMVCGDLDVSRARVLLARLSGPGDLPGEERLRERLAASDTRNRFAITWSAASKPLWLGGIGRVELRIGRRLGDEGGLVRVASVRTLDKYVAAVRFLLIWQSRWREPRRRER